MPIEIKELHIKVNVTPPDSSDGRRTSAASFRGSGGMSAKEKQEIIAECAEQVMKILKEKTER